MLIGSSLDRVSHMHIKYHVDKEIYGDAIDNADDDNDTDTSTQLTKNKW